MSGLEIIGLVAGIVSAFSSAGTFFLDWKKKRREREQQQANQRLQQLVQSGGGDIQTEYDQDFRRLGQVFARGDGKADHLWTRQH